MTIENIIISFLIFPTTYLIIVAIVLIWASIEEKKEKNKQ